MSVELRKTHLTRFMNRNGIPPNKALEEENRKKGFFEILSTYHQLLADYPLHRGALERFYRKEQLSSDIPPDLASRANEIFCRFQTFVTQFSNTTGKTEAEINQWLNSQEDAMTDLQIRATSDGIIRTNKKLAPLYEELVQEENADDIENEDLEEITVPETQAIVDPALQARLEKINTEIEELETLYAFQCQKLASLTSDRAMKDFLDRKHFSPPEKMFSADEIDKLST